MIKKITNHHNLFQKFISFENLHLAFQKASRLKKFRKDVLNFEYRLEYNLLTLQKELKNNTYQHGGYRKFIVEDPKKREIKAAPFRDRVIHHAVANIIEPIFNKGFIFDSYACRQDKGTHRAVQRLNKFVQSIKSKQALSRGGEVPGLIYCLQCDISKYFASINHRVLFELIKRKIRNKKLLVVIQKIIQSSFDQPEHENYPLQFYSMERLVRLDSSKNTDYSLRNTVRLTGIPIGNLTSQLFANIYLNELDQFIKHTLSKELKKQKKDSCASHYYIRYMDDFLFLDLDKKTLHWVKDKIKNFLETNLKLNLHPKKVNVFPIKNGIDFLGYRVFCSKPIKLRRSTVFRFIKRIKKYQEKKKKPELIWQSFQSWKGYAKHGDSYQLQQSLKERYKIFGR